MAQPRLDDNRRLRPPTVGRLAGTLGVDAVRAISGLSESAAKPQNQRHLGSCVIPANP